MNHPPIDILISEETKEPLRFVTNVISLHAEKATIPFISRYRKDQTGNMDEVRIATIFDLIEKYTSLFERKDFIIGEIDKKGKLTDTLREKIEKCFDPKQLENIYLPYKEKKKTKAEKAKEAGLEPLAQIFMGKEDAGEPMVLARNYINTEKGYDTAEKVLQGVRYIIAQNIIEKTDLMDYFLKNSFETGKIVSDKKKGYEGEDLRFEDYYGYTENLSALLLPRCSHRYLAMRRGEETGALTLKTDLDEGSHIFALTKKYLQKDHFYTQLLTEAINIAYSEYLKNAVDTRIKQELTETAETEAIGVFAKNLESLFMAPPIPYQNVIGMDPGIRTGIKTAVIDKDGKFLANTVLYINTPLEIDQSAIKLRNLIKQYKTGAIGVGTGTGSKIAFELASKTAASVSPEIITALVDEAGASVYSASELARAEFPDLDVTVRGAISIGRRLQNPLAELVKVDPRSVGVGQYQHDVDQKKLKETLARVVEICVNSIGVDINTASYSILTYISGLSDKIAKNIIEFREENGLFKSRLELKKVKGIGPKIFEQCAGFLRISQGNDPLDNTRVHPESYKTVALIAGDYSMKPSDLIGNKELLAKITPDKYINSQTGKLAVNSIIEDLKFPARDPRKQFINVKFAEGIESLNDLKIEMELEGRVTNVTNFGAFIDIGVHNDGLCHISQMGDRFVKDPSDIVKAGDIVKVKVINIDIPKKRISLRLLTEK